MCYYLRITYKTISVDIELIGKFIYENIRKKICHPIFELPTKYFVDKLPTKTVRPAFNSAPFS